MLRLNTLETCKENKSYMNSAWLGNFELLPPSSFSPFHSKFTLDHLMNMKVRSGIADNTGHVCSKW